MKFKPIERFLEGFSRGAEIAGRIVDALRSVWLWESARNGGNHEGELGADFRKLWIGQAISQIGSAKQPLPPLLSACSTSAPITSS
jgi:hypothetical protein